MRVRSRGAPVSRNRVSRAIANSSGTPVCPNPEIVTVSLFRMTRTASSTVMTLLRFTSALSSRPLPYLTICDILLNCSQAHFFRRLSKSQGIPVAPALRDFAVCNAENSDTCHCHRFPYRGDASELVLMSGLHLPTNDHLIPLGDQIFHRPLSVGESIQRPLYSSLRASKTWIHSRR